MVDPIWGHSIITWTRGGGWVVQYQLIFVHVHSTKCPRRGGWGVKNVQNHVHVVIEWPLCRISPFWTNNLIFSILVVWKSPFDWLFFIINLIEICFTSISHMTFLEQLWYRLTARFTTQILGKNFTTAISCGPGAIHAGTEGHRAYILAAKAQVEKKKEILIRAH